MRLAAMQPMPGVAEIPKSKRDELFWLALKVLEYDNLAYSTKSLEGYTWHISNVFPYQAFIQIVTHVMHGAEGDEVERAWAAINQAYEDHPELINDTKHALKLSLGNLVLKAWGTRPAAFPIGNTAVTKLQARRRLRAPKLDDLLSARIGDAWQTDSSLNWAQLLLPQRG